MKELIIIISLAAIITVTILFVAGIFNRKSSSSNTNTVNADKLPGIEPDNPEEVRKKYNLAPNDTYILPKEFKIGLIKQDKPHFMNNCNPDVLYPINGLGPDYGWKMPTDCRCTEFVQAP